MEYKLDGIRLFSKLSQDEMKELSDLLTEFTYEPGEFIFKEGEDSHSFHIITSGTVEVFSSFNQNQDVEIIKIGSGNTVGEVGFIDGKERTASVKCITPTTTLCLSKKIFTSIIESNSLLAMKILKEIGIILSERLRWCDKILVSDREMRVSSRFMDAIESSV